jgi:hypothetical protein
VTAIIFWFSSPDKDSAILFLAPLVLFLPAIIGTKAQNLYALSAFLTCFSTLNLNTRHVGISFVRVRTLHPFGESVAHINP